MLFVIQKTRVLNLMHFQEETVQFISQRETKLLKITVAVIKCVNNDKTGFLSHLEYHFIKTLTKKDT